MTTSLNEVRAKVIEAVPEIKTHREPCQCKDHGNCPFADHARVGRPCQLADVLRAIEKQTEIVGWLKVLERFEKHTDISGNQGDLYYFLIANWNLSLPLEEQSEEVISFLHKILCHE